MPIYEYYCEDCDSSFEALVQSGHHDEAHCPSCSSANISRQMSVFASRAAGNQARSNGSAGQPMSGGSCCGGSCGCH